METNIIIPDRESFEKKKDVFIRGGASRLHVLSDFDRTLTCAFFKGQKTPSLIYPLRNGNYLSSDYVRKAQALADRYKPIEIDSNVSLEEKSKAMFQWWKSHYDLLVECGLDEETMKKVVTDLINEGKLRLRKRGKDFLKILDEKNIPLFIMSSAGIGNMVVEFLREQGVMYDNIHFLGNTLEFDSKGKFKGIVDNKIIHRFNKREIEIKDLPIYGLVSKKRNVLLLGDNIEDLQMVEGFPYENLIKIGFLNENIEENFESYKKAFDVVILNDGGMGFVVDLMREIVK